MDNRLKFESQTIRDKVKKANSILKYANKGSRGMEVNMALIIYKSLIRSIIDYGSPVQLDEDNSNNIQKIEKVQYLGLRSALGYRNSTPTNIMIAETKVTIIRNRTRMLAKNCLMLEDNLVRKAEIEGWVKEERKMISCTPWRKKGILTTSWENIWKHKDNI